MTKKQLFRLIEVLHARIRNLERPPQFKTGDEVEVYYATSAGTFEVYAHGVIESYHACTPDSPFGEYQIWDKEKDKHFTADANFVCPMTLTVSKVHDLPGLGQYNGTEWVHDMYNKRAWKRFLKEHPCGI